MQNQSSRGVLLEGDVLWMCWKFPGAYLCMRVILIKLQSGFVEIALLCWCSPVGSIIVLEVIRTILFFYQEILHKNFMPKKHNTACKLRDICPDKIVDKKKKKTFCLRTRCNDKTIST